MMKSMSMNRAVVTGEMSPVYNCISWTVGVANRWIWPGNTLAQFDTFYRGFGLQGRETGRSPGSIRSRT